MLLGLIWLLSVWNLTCVALQPPRLAFFRVTDESTTPATVIEDGPRWEHFSPPFYWSLFRWSPPKELDWQDKVVRNRSDGLPPTQVSWTIFRIRPIRLAAVAGIWLLVLVATTWAIRRAFRSLPRRRQAGFEIFPPRPE